MPGVRYKTDFPATGGTSFYLFESDNIAKTTNLLTNNFITIKVTNNHATPYWYRIDMKDYNTVNGFYDILRNRHYKVDLTEGTTIDTPGADTEEEAIKGRFKLKCKIVPWYDVNEEVVVDELKRINVDSRSIYISKSEALTGKTITIKTENTSGWTITDVPSWLNVSQTSNTSDGTTTVTVSSNVVATGIKVGNFTIKARNAQYLEMPISVRIGKLPLEYVAEYNLAGGIQYGSIPRDVTPTGAQTEAALRWATNHNNDQSGYYNWYVCKGVYDATYNPNTKNLFNDVFFITGAGKDYHLPSQAEWTGATSYAHACYHYYSSSPNINEAIEFGDTKGTYASDYYHSDHLVPGFPSDTRVGYALRYKKATGNPLGGFSTIDFPQATDNSLACAFRYERLHLLNYSNDIPANVKVQCVYVGDQDPLPDLYTVIARESWWNAQPADKVITRIFEVPGYFRQAKPSEVGPFNDTYTSRGRNGYFWSSEEKDTSTSFAMWVINSGIVSYSANDKHMGSSVRLFSNE